MPVKNLFLEDKTLGADDLKNICITAPTGKNKQYKDVTERIAENISDEKASKAGDSKENALLKGSLKEVQKEQSVVKVEELLVMVVYQSSVVVQLQKLAMLQKQMLIQMLRQILLEPGQLMMYKLYREGLKL